MEQQKIPAKTAFLTSILLIWAAVLWPVVAPRKAWAYDLQEIKQAGVLRHLGIPYANFVTGSGDGLDVELIKLFAERLGVRYEYVRTGWNEAITDLTGKKFLVKKDGDVKVTGEAPIRGDLIANGMTILPWRKKVVDFSLPTFPTQIWLIARADSPMKPITPTGDIGRDIALTKEVLRGHTTMGKEKTCLDPDLYRLEQCASGVILFDGGLNELAPALITDRAESTILDVPDALVALEKWPGELKIIGPVSPRQKMGVGFAKTAPDLRQAFDTFLTGIIADGTYTRLVKKYYLAVFDYYPEFFRKQQ
ncbi:MAG: transporter substrate-binding domain-containing protein [Deltaproteobacteria bacterium]|nr:transporter substrate-binding domain-containing protein [Deltaproteobacteria bacterium]